MNEFLTIGHRGAKGYVMENTITSIDYALKLGVNAIEIDVYKCLTGELVVFHDETLERLSARANRIEDLSLDEIRLLLLHGGYSIPTLEEVIVFLDNRVVLNVELKGLRTATEAFSIITKCIEKGIFDRDNLIISSFHDDELRAYRRLDANVKLGVLTRTSIEDDLDLAKELKAYSLHPFFKECDKSLIELAHDLALKVFPFTVNEEIEIEQYIRDGADGMFCDYPDRVLKILKNQSQINKD